MPEDPSLLTIEQAARRFLSDLDTIYREESWDWALREMSEDVSTTFSRMVERLQVAVAQADRETSQEASNE